MKAVLVVIDRTSRDDLKALADKGAAGARVSMLFSSGTRADELALLTGNGADLGWHSTILADVPAQLGLTHWVSGLSVPVVFDHMGQVEASKGVNSPGFQALLKSLDSGKVWIKLSGANHITAGNSDAYTDVTSMAEALVAANPEPLVWDSDWPHPAFDGPMPGDGDLLDLVFD